jgi:hypothetical protein
MVNLKIFVKILLGGSLCQKK